MSDEFFLLALCTVVSTLVGFCYLYKINWIEDSRVDGKIENVFAKHLTSRRRRVGRLPPVFPNGWFGLLESYQLNRGCVKHVTALGENFAVFRTEDGKVRILDAYCPHLGANMAEGGSVKGDCIECPFHGWRFRGEDGACENIPYAEKLPGNVYARTWPCRELNGLVFVWYHAEGTEPLWEPRSVQSIASGQYSYGGRNEFYIGCHIQEIPENGADPCHLNTLHAPILFPFPLWKLRHRWFDVSWTESAEEKHVALLQLRHEITMGGSFRFLQIDVDVKQIGPGYVEMNLSSNLGNMCILQTVTPIEPMLQKVVHIIYRPPMVAPFATLSFLGETFMFRRDVRIWNKKRFEKNPVIVKEDKTIPAYRRWYSQFYSENSPTYQNAIKSYEW